MSTEKIDKLIKMAQDLHSGIDDLYTGEKPNIVLDPEIKANGLPIVIEAQKYTQVVIAQLGKLKEDA